MWLGILWPHLPECVSCLHQHQPGWGWLFFFPVVTDTLSICFLIWNIPVEERQKLLLRAFYSSLKQVVLFMIYERSLCKRSWHDQLVGGERWGADSALIPVPCSEHSCSPPCLPSAPYLCLRLCWGSSFPSLFQRLLISRATEILLAVNLDFES